MMLQQLKRKQEKGNDRKNFLVGKPAAWPRHRKPHYGAKNLPLTTEGNRTNHRERKVHYITTANKQNLTVQKGTKSNIFVTN
jgi:hypothetical protein